MNDLEITKKFFNEVIELDGINYIEIRIQDNDKKYNPISKYVKTFEEYLEILNTFKKDRWNIYFGVNKRPEKVRLMKEIPYRYIHYFDVEHVGDKPPFSNKDYLTRLSKGVNVIINLMRDNYKIEYAALIKTGRGVSLYYKFKPLYIDKENKFKQWIKYNVFDEIREAFKKEPLLFDQEKKEFIIKAWDSVFDSSRINGAPLSIHTKYPERPKRIVLNINKSIIHNNVESILSSVKIRVKKRISKKIKSKPPKTPHSKSFIRSKKFQDTEEFKILLRYQNLPEGEIKKCIIFPLKMFCRDHDKKRFNLLISELNRLGYDSEHNIPENEYEYSESVFRNWCYRNYKWCLKNNFLVKYKLFTGIKPKFVSINKNIYISHKDQEELGTMEEVIKFVIKFNRKYSYVSSKQILFVDYESLLRNLQSLCQPKLFEFLSKNNLIKQIMLFGLY